MRRFGLNLNNETAMEEVAGNILEELKKKQQYKWFDVESN